MMKVRYTAVAALLGAVVVARTACGEDVQPTIAVYPAVRGPAATDPGTVGLDQQEITRRLEEALRASRHFRLFERNAEIQRAVLDEQDFAKSERALGNAAQFGKMYNVALIVQPFISEFR